MSREKSVFKIISSYTVLLWLLLAAGLCAEPVRVGVDVLLEEGIPPYLKGKRVGLITNQSALNGSCQTTVELLKTKGKGITVAALFAPEHGYYGDAYAYEQVAHQELDGIPLYSLYGTQRRPSQKMCEGLDVLIYDIQDIGSRSYTFLSTLFYCMEAAAAYHLPLIVLDRPNPMGGLVVDGPLVEEKWRSFLGYIRIPYCHGMTIGELALLFNEEYHVGCTLTVIPMKGWKRSMTFTETGLPWVPTSPQIPECDTPFFYPTTGLIGHCSLTSIGIGYTLPFKLVGAPWINGDRLSATLNQQHLPGVYFQSYRFRPFFGKFKSENCQGVRIVVTDPSGYLPVTTQFTIMGVLKQLYPEPFSQCLDQLAANRDKKELFHKLAGSEEVLSLLLHEKYAIWKLRRLCVQGRDQFLPLRQKYLLPNYHLDLPKNDQIY